MDRLVASGILTKEDLLKNNETLEKGKTIGNNI